ncbi:A-kinase anchor protein 13 isoform X2 [Hyla sarda]|uniref:A-kinase anchor protein 13 isoform X2 n=1 Tax=Hyla sarda TaxID=327740 RepID=UPI0024C2FA96|nr:A-kinase anchor protein 13 isoform X2 [Hyla sarda]
MKLYPTQAPLYGDCVLTVSLTEQRELEDDAVFYLLFAGSTLKHLASTRKIDSATLETVTPGHDCCEQVKVLLFASKKGLSAIVAQEDFKFIKDEAYESAQFLVSSVGNQQALLFAKFFLSKSRSSPWDAAGLDKKITLAFRHLQLPSGWNVLGECPSRTDGPGQETLMHFAARLGLCALSKFLLEQPGGRTSLAIANSEGATPVTLALERGFLELHHLLTDVDPQRIVLDIDDSHVEHSGDFWVQHHHGLNVYTLTKKSQLGAHDNMENSIKELSDYIQSHSPCPGTNMKIQLEVSAEESDACHQGVTASANPVGSQASIGVLQGENEGAKPCSKSDNAVETVGGGIVSSTQDVYPKEEEEETKCIVKAENTSVTNQHVPSYSAEVPAAENLLSGGNTNEETGMTSTGTDLDPKALCKSGIVGEEMKAEPERDSSNLASHTVTDQDVNVNMGQSVSSYCTGASGATDTVCQSGSSEQEAVSVCKDGQSSNVSGDLLSQGEPLTCLASETGPLHDAQGINVLDCSQTCDPKKEKSKAALQSRTLDQFAHSLVLSVVDGVLAMRTDHPKDGALDLNSGKDVETIAEKLTASIISASLVELEVTSSAKAMVTHTDNMPSTLSEEVLSGSVVKDFIARDGAHTQEDTEVPVAKLHSKIGENTAPEILLSCSEPSLSQESLALSNKSVSVKEQNIQSVESSSDLQNVLEVANAATSVPKEIEEQLNVVRTEKQETPPPAAPTTLLQEDEVLPCAKSELHKDSDTPSLFNNYECLNNQEVLTVDSVLIDVSSEMQEAAVTAASEPSTDHGQLTCEHDQGDGDLCTKLCEKGTERVEEDTGILLLLDQSADYKLTSEDRNAGEKEAKEVVKEAGVEYEGGEDDSVLVESPRASLHPIAEETLLNGEFTSDTTSTDRDDAASSDVSDSKKSVGAEEEKTDVYSQATDCLSDEEAVAEETSLICSNGDICMAEGRPVQEVLVNEVVQSFNIQSFQDEENYGKGLCASPHIFKEDDSGLDLSVNLEDTLCLSISDTEIVSAECLDSKDDDEVDFGKLQLSPRTKVIKENCCSLTPCPHPVVLASKPANDTKECRQFLEDSLNAEHSSPLTLKRDQASDSDLSYMPPEVLDEMIFTKLEDEQSINTASSGSEDTLSLDRNSSHGSDISLPHALTERKHIDLQGSTMAGSGKIMVPEKTGMTETAGEEKDNITGVSPHTVQSRSTVRSLSPSRRHSWEPGKNKGNNAEIGQRSCSLEGLSGIERKPRAAQKSSSGKNRLSGSPFRGEDHGSLTSLTEEERLPDNGTDGISKHGSSGNADGSGSEDNSLERNSSHGSDVSFSHTLSERKDSNPLNSSVGDRENEKMGISENEGEEMDSITEVSPHALRSRSTIRSLSPFRRHSWEPGKHKNNNAEINRRSSLRVLGDVIKKPATHRRSMSWCPSDAQFTSIGGDFNYRSYSLEGLAENNPPAANDSFVTRKLTGALYKGEDHGSLTSLTEEEQESDQRIGRTSHHVANERSEDHDLVYSGSLGTSRLSKSMSLSAIANPLIEVQGRIQPKRRISFSFSISPLIPKSKHVFSIGTSSSDDESDSSRPINIGSSSLTHSISEECNNQLPPSPSQKDLEGKGVTKVSRTFSYIRNKMSSGKKTKEKDKDKAKDKEKEPSEKSKEKHKSNGHIFVTGTTMDTLTCKSCDKPFTKKSCYVCQECGLAVHRGCRDTIDPCPKIKEEKVVQPQGTVPQAVVMRNKGSQPKERPRSAIVVVDEKSLLTLGFNARRPQTALAISKSISTQNLSGLGRDDNLLSSLRALSQSTDSLHKTSKVNESMESLSDEGTDLYEGQLLGEFEMDSKQLEKASWSEAVDSMFLMQQMKEVVKRQDVIYELMQTEMHHILRLKIMSDIYCQGMSSELQYEQQVIEKIFPCMEDLLNIHTQFFQRMLERKRESMADKSEKNFVIRRIGDICSNQFSGENAERMIKTYGKFCGHHKEALDYFKDLLSKDKRFQAFVKKKSSSPLVRRMGIPECLLLVTQRITKYPIILERILHYTDENEMEHQSVTYALGLLKEVVNGVNNKVKNYEMKKRLHEIYSKTDSKSIQRMKSGQMFAKEDLKRRKFVRDGPVFLRSNQTSRSKEALAVLLSDVLVFLQEKDQKYVFASLEQKSTVISLKNLIVREVAHDEKGLFLISMVGKNPELVEVLASTKEERNSWIGTIKETMQTMEKDEDEGVQSESEEEKRNCDAKAKELKEQLQQKDDQIIALLEEKEKIFQSLVDFSSHEKNFAMSGRILFRANTEEAPRGESLIKSAIKEVETLQVLLNQNLWSSIVQQAPCPADLEAGLGSVSLPRRAETFGGFDSHQLNASKSGERDEGEDAQDLRRTESDSVLKKGVSPSVMLKRNGEHVLQTVTNLHKLLGNLQAVVLQQDTFIEQQKLRLSEKKPLTRTTSKPKSLTEQEKVEQLLQDIVNLEKQQTDQQVPLQQEKLTRGPPLPDNTDSLKRYNSIAPKQEPLDSKPSAVPKKDTLSRTESKQKGKSHFSLLGSQANKPVEGPATNRLFNLSKTKEKKEKKKKSKGNHCTDTVHIEGVSQEEEIFC